MSPASVKLSAKVAKYILEALEHHDGHRRPTECGIEFPQCADLLRAQLAPKPRSSAKKKTEKRKRDRAKETRAIYGKVELRAAGRCEVPNCSLEFGTANGPELDHFLPKGRYPQSERTCWLIHWGCHRGKHASYPERAFWLRQFIEHCGKHGYAKEAEIARAELEAGELLVAAESVGTP